MLGFFVALLSGALMSVQGVFNTEVTKNSSMWAGNAWVQFSAFIVCIVAWYVTGKSSIGDVFLVPHKYTLLGGVIGAFITWTVVKSMANLGPANAVLIIVISQIAVAYLIELFGIFGVEKANFSWMKLFGMALAIGGIFMFQKN